MKLFYHVMYLCLHFTDIQNREDGNLVIINVYLDGYTQSSISRYLNILKPLVLKVIKDGDGATEV